MSPELWQTLLLIGFTAVLLVWTWYLGFVAGREWDDED